MSSPFYQLQNGAKSLDFSSPRIMGIVNCTADSFYSGSRFMENEAVSAGIKMLESGADLLDIGGQSSRPGAIEVGAHEEWRSIETPLKGILDAAPEALISIDTFHAEVAHKALEAGAFLINDIYGGTRDDEMIEVIKAMGCPYAIMHMQGTPQTMQTDPTYLDPVTDVIQWLQSRLDHLRKEGIDQCMIDPGFGFGKNLRHNFDLLNRLDSMHVLDCPILVGVSRKSMIWKSLQCTPEEALNGSTALHAWALQRGAHLLRVHDVRAAREVVTLHHQLISASTAG
jgi:dihydropteroate synthase